MKLWLDDIRKPPDSTWTWVTTVDEAISFISKWRVEEASLDNDLGKDQPEGRKLVLWMAEHNCWPKQITIHSANPVAAEYMEGMIARYKH